MKKFWKNLCVTSLAVVSALGLTGCGEDDASINYDIDKDGVVSNWESPFERLQVTKRPSMDSNKDIVEISSLEEFKAISDKSAEFTIFRLKENIDCKGQELCVNLGTSVLLGNGKTISNFKLGTFAFAEGNNNRAMCVIYGGLGVYDLNLHMGLQNITLTEKVVDTCSAISAIVGAENIDNVHAKGKFVVQRKIANAGQNKVDISLLASDKNEVETNVDKQVLKVSNSTSTGVIEYVEEVGGATTTRIGGISAYINDSSSISNCNAIVDVKVSTAHNLSIGLIAGEMGTDEKTLTHSIISSCSTSGNISFGLQGSGNDISLGGIVGKAREFAYVKNCKTDANITNFANSTTTLSSHPQVLVGGIAGLSNGTLEYVTSDASIKLNNLFSVISGGIAGQTKGAVFSNIISRGSIAFTSIDRIITAEMVGIVDGGLIEKAIVNTTLDVNNSEIDCEYVNMGMLMTIADESEENKVEGDIYTAYNCPSISGVYISGNSKVTMREKTPTQENLLNYELGLRTGDKNSFKYIKNPDSLVDDEKFSIRTPMLFNNIYYLKDGYKLLAVIIGDETKEEGVNPTYAPSVATKDNSMVKQSNFYLYDLGFRNGVNHKEIDLADYDIANIKFTLDSNQNTGYFDIDNYNGEYVYFDKFIENECAFSTSDEMFSLIKYLMENKYLLDKSGSYVTPIIVSDTFISSTLQSETPEEEIPEDSPEETPGVDLPDQDFDDEDNSQDEGWSELEPINDDNQVQEPSGDGTADDNDDNSSTDDNLDNSGTIEIKRRDQLFMEKIEYLIELMHYSNMNRPIVIDSENIVYLNKEGINIMELDDNIGSYHDNQVRYVEMTFQDVKTFRLTFDVKELTESQKSAYLIMFKFEMI